MSALLGIDVDALLGIDVDALLGLDLSVFKNLMIDCDFLPGLEIKGDCGYRLFSASETN